MKIEGEDKDKLIYWGACAISVFLGLTIMLIMTRVTNNETLGKLAGTGVVALIIISIGWWRFLRVKK